jgi:PAS domain S-box-containing protein
MELLASPAVADAVFEVAPLPAVLVDASTASAPLVRANAAFRSLVEDDCEPGRRLTELLDGVGDLALRLRRDGVRLIIPASCLRNGQTVAVTVHGALIPTEANPSLALVQIEEVAPRLQVERALRESEKRLEDVADNVPALIYIKRADGRYLLVNHHFEREFGLDRVDVNTRTDFDIFPDSIAREYRANDQRVIATGRSMEFEERRSRGGVYLSLKFPIFGEDARPYAVGGISTDISDRNRAERAIREAKDVAERANREKSLFLSRMSHELRTPLNSIIGFGRLLQTEHDSPEVTAKADRIVRAGGHLLALINEILEISRIEQSDQPVAVAPVEACTPLQEALEIVGPLAAERGIELVIDYHAGLYRYVLADAQRLEQVLLNVLSNAVKYNRDGGVVTVSVHDDGSRLQYRVADTGRGLREDEVQRIFTPFERLGAEISGIEGTGLGLAVSRTMIDAMGGRIGVARSVPGRGSLFYVELPLTDAPAPAAPGQAPAEPIHIPGGARLDGVRVLCIEDNAFNVELVEAVLTGAGATLVSASDGRGGLQLARGHRPDVVLLDLHLPDLDGQEVLRRLRGDPLTKEIPVIVLSADAMPGRIRRLRDAGADEYLTKPLDTSLMVEAIVRLCPAHLT